METDKKEELNSFLKVLPAVDFCCVYGSSLHPNNQDKVRSLFSLVILGIFFFFIILGLGCDVTVLVLHPKEGLPVFDHCFKASMVDYILGVSDPLQWHSQNLELNRDHYSSWLAYIGGAKLVTGVADKIGVGVHFNPFVIWEGKLYKYGVLRMHDLVQDLLNWDRFYLSGRLQKPVHLLVDNLDIGDVNSANLRAAVSAALLLLPSHFSEEDLYAKICSLSYMGDVRMLFAEDRNKVRNIVRGQYNMFQTMYKPFLKEYETKNLISFSSYAGNKANISLDCDLSATQSLVSALPPTVKGYMSVKLGEKKTFHESGRVVNEVMIRSREEASKCMQKVLRRTVMASSARQAVSGFLTAGGLNAARYLAKKMSKACKSWGAS